MLTVEQSPQRVLSLREGVRFADVEGELVARHRWGVTRLGRPAPAVRGALEALRTGSPSEDELADLVLGAGAGTEADLASLLWTVSRLRFLVVRQVRWEGRTLISVTPIATASAFAPRDVEAGTALRLSRFAFSRRLVDEPVLESPLALERVTLSDPRAAAVVAALATTPLDLDDLARRSGLEVPAVAEVAGHLLGTGMVGAVRDGGLEEDRDDALRQWDFHDLVFHSRSRRGRHDYSYGSAYRFRGEIAPLPAVKPAPPGAGIELHRPRFEELVAGDRTLTEILEARMSVRDHGEEPVAVEQLGDFLYRVARVRATYGPMPEAGLPYEASDRPYPTGGAGHDLELYLTVNRCRGLERGVYHYDPLAHRLHLLHRRRPEIDAMLREASLSAAGAPPPHVLVTITSRFQRLAWKYDSIAYAATLKNVGVLYQTMYLVATAMGLAPCALGGGDSDLAARTFGLDPVRESSVGEFMLGSLPAGMPFAQQRERALAYQRTWRPANDPAWTRIRSQVIRQPLTTGWPEPEGGDGG